MLGDQTLKWLITQEYFSLVYLLYAATLIFKILLELLTLCI